MDPIFIAMAVIAAGSLLLLMRSVRSTQRRAEQWRSAALWDSASVAGDGGSAAPTGADASAGAHGSADGGACGMDGGGGGHC